MMAVGVAGAARSHLATGRFLSATGRWWPIEHLAWPIEHPEGRP